MGLGFRLPSTICRVVIDKEVTLASNLKGVRERAEASFTKKEQAAQEGQKARMQYEAEGRAVLEKTERLRALRLAKEQADRDAIVDKPAVSGTKKPRSARSK